MMQSKSIKRIIRQKLYNLVWIKYSKINPKPIFILGNPKSGTSAIAQLLAIASNRSKTIDFKRAIPRATLQLELKYHILSFPQFINNYKYEFSKDIIKEPFLTFFTDDLLSHFPNSRFIFIVRDPFQNIRSILNRLKIPGNLENIGFFDWEELNITPAWKLAMQSDMLGYQSKNYIDAMAYRWNFVVEKYLEQKDRFELVKYEEFRANKAEYINQLCDTIGLEIEKDISSKVDVQYQPRGNSDVEVKKFFGEKNFNLIVKNCKKNMEYFGYTI